MLTTNSSCVDAFFFLSFSSLLFPILARIVVPGCATPDETSGEIALWSKEEVLKRADHFRLRYRLKKKKFETEE